MPDNASAVPPNVAPVSNAPVERITAVPRITRRRTFDEILEQERAAAREEARKRNNPFFGIGGIQSPVDAAEFSQAFEDYRPPSESIDEDESSFSSVAITQQLRQHRHPLSSALVSMVVHLAIFLMLALFVLNWPEPQPSIGIFAKIEANPVPEKPVNFDNETVEIPIPDDSQSPMDATATDTAVNETVEVTNDADTIPSVAVNDVAPTNNDQIAVNDAPTKVLPTGGGLEGRTKTARAKLAAARGGSLASEAAVENALAWIIAHQKQNGSWRFRHNCEACNGQCANQGSSEDFTNAATGLALMSLLGAGYTHETGPYQDEIRKGLDYLTSKIRMSQMDGKRVGSLADRGSKGMYGHAIATIAISEAYAMTGDTGLYRAVVALQQYTELSQNKKGSWRYIRRQSPGDITVTGWQIMALKSCQLAGVKTGDVTWMRTKEFINSLISSDGKYGYQKPSVKITRTTTAVGVLSKMYLGTHREDIDLVKGADHIAWSGPSKNDIYFNYYATQVLHHRGGDPWKVWNGEMRDFLIQTQDNSNTHQAGSWYFADKAGHSKTGGRLYTTAMSVMILEVYYRYMPLYEKKAMESVVGDE
ncbi:MAG: prenyltransferase/squalene oxidase repeat-containing protein [Mariniblastus sp.]